MKTREGVLMFVLATNTIMAYYNGNKGFLIAILNLSPTATVVSFKHAHREIISKL